MFTIRNQYDDGELPLLYEIEKECFTKEFRWTEKVFKKTLEYAR
jgi:hypothetical protein